MEPATGGRALAGTVEFARHLSGKGAGAAFLVGDSERVLALSKSLYPIRLVGRPKIWERRHWDFLASLAGTLDGAVVIDSDGGVVAVGMLLKPKSEVGLEGLGPKHRAVCAMTADTGAVGVTVSEEDGRIRIFRGGKMLRTIEPHT
jgi:DNA integrity scanning protein DisA with diadenylate cyclase activity